MKDFLKYTLASMVGFILANIILGIIFTIFFLVSIGSVMTMAEDFQSGKKVSVDDKSVLHIQLDYPIKERVTDDPFRRFSRRIQERPNPIGLRQAINSIEKAKEDDKIEGILLETSMIPASYTSLKDIRSELKAFKESDKFIYAYSNVLTQKGYYLSSLADSIVLQPEGLVQFTGMNSEMTFYKGLFDKLGITPHIFKAGKYKSAAESFSHKEMTEPNREQMNALLTSMDDDFLGGISEARGISINQLKAIRDQLDVRSAEDALEYNFVDQLLYEDQLKSQLKQKIGQGTESLSLVSLQDYKQTPSLDDKDEGDSEGEVALVYATGGIGMGDGGSESIGSDRLSEAMKKAREDDEVESIVLRINSPGGSALASDIIWREVQLTTEEKPVVVSMGNLAASGGYYIASPADTIFAQPNTITGSIGVIGVLFDWQEFWNEETGITFDRVKKGKFADLGNPNRPLTEKEGEIIQSFIMETYNDFLSRVAEGRNMQKARVDSLAQGRVWSGEDAKDVGLVDAMGGIETAIESAAKKADLDNYDIKTLPKVEDPFQKFMKEFSASINHAVWGSKIKEKLNRHKRLKLLTEEGNGIYMLMPYDFQIE